ncbi:hypothetical protein Poli38472_000615 [Pythium oligandrum]|uniref:Uncharacterized protein n=1 Tax=Pythium oligandrum TaxID=41045 RepID=A0A8K1CCN2_PYTOL|nr:hypothetical protein Poli38472_000615 [Pythium oligandrum]|eukprot:TMW60573.1 hypothetical protein Poli38472_000615 [Pythium oligandrum]
MGCENAAHFVTCSKGSVMMIWRDDEKNELQQLQKKLEYARELDEQIEVRKAREREEQEQQLQWERRYLASGSSPSKWWTEARETATPGGNGAGVAAAIHGDRFVMDKSALPYANPAIEHGEHGPSSSVSASSAGFSRFRVTDDEETRTRLREKAQQMEWKRVLDEQVREKERRQRQEAEERRRQEMEEVQEEMRMLRDQQLRAQRKYGFPTGFPSVETASYAPQNYLAIPSPPAPSKPEEVEVNEPPTPVYERNYSAMPPPAPTTLRANDTIDYNFRRSMGLMDPPESSRNHIVDEYRLLLLEIRREREELRREREEVRQEKEELRMERALLQLENEKMSTLLESQRRMNEQQLELQVKQPPQRDVDVQPQPEVERYQRRPSTAQYRPPTPEVINDYLEQPLQVHVNNRLHNRLANLTIGRRSASPPAIERRASPMSIAEFAPLGMRTGTPNLVTSPRLHRLARYRPQYDENPLEQSLIGESEFVGVNMPVNGIPALSPDRIPSRPRGTTSPSMRNDGYRQREDLRSSRVIKSRGFYDFGLEEAHPPAQEDSEDGTFADHHSPLRTPASPSQRRRQRTTEPVSQVAAPVASSPPRATWRDHFEHSDHEEEEEYDDNGEYDDEEYEDEYDEEDTQDTPSELSRSLFQVHVLVNERS